MPLELKLMTFALATLGLAYVSRRSLGDRRSHGFYRFLAWEAIVALVLLNLDRWFARPFSFLQILSWACLAVSLFLVIHGLRLLRRLGRPDPARNDDTLVGLERTTKLVTEGAYRWIRHPLYSSLLFLTWGAFLKHPSWPAAILALVGTALLTVTGKVEEQENLRYFGPAYADYMRRTKMFIPFVL
jgi:protein-S-isoprenylcysteine O-methyltransferase Ste14